MRKLLKPRVCLLAFAIVVLVPCAAAGQGRERLIEWDWKSPARPAPLIKEGAGDEGPAVETYFVALELVGVFAAGEAVAVGLPFAAEDDWMKDLKVRFRNVSGKSIAGATLHLSLPEARQGGGVMTFSLGYGGPKEGRPVVAPGEEFEVTRTPAEHERQQRRLAKVGGVTGVGRVGLGFVVVTFEDGGEWSCQLQALAH